MTTILVAKFNNDYNYTDSYIMTEEEYNKLVKRMDKWRTLDCKSADYMAWDPINVAYNITKEELTKFVLESDRAVAWDILRSDEYGFEYEFSKKLLDELNFNVMAEN